MPPSIALDPARASVRPLRRPQRPARADRRSAPRRSASPCSCCCPATDRADAWTWGVASVCLFALGLSAVVAPITAAALSPAPEDLAGVAAGPQPDRGAGRRHPLGRGDRRARRGRVRRPRRRGRHAVRPVSRRSRAAKQASTRSTASSSPSRRSRSSPRSLAATALRGHRQSRTPSSVSSATLRSSPPP